VLILGATGVAGKLAVQIAKQLGARRVMASGRNPRALEKLRGFGADSTVQLNRPDSWSGRQKAHFKSKQNLCC
jgi:NADPH:quinone reductase-like Zn-dependent oxidoreductase